MPINSEILDVLIKNQKDAIRYQTVFAVIVVSLGLCLIIFSSLFVESSGTNDSIKLILSLGGGFISTISAYPINQIINRKEKISTYNIFRLKIETMSESEAKKVEELIWKSIEKTI